MIDVDTPRCPACGSSITAAFQHISQLPLLLFPVPEAVRYAIKNADLTALQCRACWHAFTPPLSAEDARLIYEEYYEYYPFDNLETMGPVYRKPFDDLFHRVMRYQAPGRLSKLLEIGCASESQLAKFAKYGLESWGIDPSKRESTRNSRILTGIYERVDLGMRFDVIVARFVLEHSNSLDRFLDKVNIDLNEGGLLFVQVPNIAEFASSGLPFFLAHEHPQYFNHVSLDTAMSRRGFKKLELVHRQSMSLIGAYQKCESSTCNPADEAIAEVFVRYEKQTQHVTGQVRKFFSQRAETNIAFYGAGLTLCWLLYVLKENVGRAPGLAIDDNDQVHGYYMPRTEVRIYPRLSLSPLVPDSVICTLNPAYHRQVVKRIRSGGYGGEIMLLNRNGLQADVTN